MGNNRILYLSRVKALSCVAIIVLHTFYMAYSYAVSIDTKSCLISVRNAMMWAVPCFVMASGALLLDSKRVLNMKKLFGKYILRMLLTLVIFSVIFSVFDAVTTEHYTITETINDIFSDIFLGTGWIHMWYIYLMIAIYLLLPFYKLIAKNASASELRYLMLIYAVFLSVIPFIETLSGKKLPVYICVYTIYPLFFFLGHSMHTGLIKLPKNACGLMFLICAGISTMLTVYCISTDPASSDTVNKVKELLNAYNFPLYIVLSIAAFGFMRKTRNKPVPVLDTIASEIDSCSFGIYLIHMAFLKLIFEVIKFDPFAQGGVIVIVGICLVTLVISYGVTRILKLIPYVNKII